MRMYSSLSVHPKVVRQCKWQRLVWKQFTWVDGKLRQTVTKPFRPILTRACTLQTPHQSLYRESTMHSPELTRLHIWRGIKALTTSCPLLLIVKLGLGDHWMHLNLRKTWWVKDTLSLVYRVHHTEDMEDMLEGETVRVGSTEILPAMGMQLCFPCINRVLLCYPDRCCENEASVGFAILGSACSRVTSTNSHSTF